MTNAKARLSRARSLSSRWPTCRPIRSRRIVTGLSAITCDHTRKPFLSLGSIVTRKSGASLQSEVIWQALGRRNCDASARDASAAQLLTQRQQLGYCLAMSYILERREEEKERRRGEFLDAAESLYAKVGWDAMTMDQVARTARLSRALVYTYFRDKDDLLFAIGERAMKQLHQRFAAALETPGSGRDQVMAIGRAYMGYALEFPHYFDFCSRFQRHEPSAVANPNEEACGKAGDAVMELVVRGIERGVADGSIAPAHGREPLMMAFSLWAFTHGIVQITVSKAADLARHGMAVPEFGSYSFGLLEKMLSGGPS
jgi:AcrR family transcriptional regulator